MKKSSICFFLILFLISGSFLTSKAQHKPDDITGAYFNDIKSSKIQIYKEGNKYFGKIIWLKETLDKTTGKPRVDNLNPDPKLRNTPLMGLVLLKNFVFDGKDEWENGTIYDPKNGKTYSCYIKFENPMVLKIRGYIGISLLGRTTLWTRTTIQ